MASTVPWMSSGKKSSLVAQVWAQLAHVTVMIVMPFTTSVQPTCRHLGQLIGRWRSVLGIGGLVPNFGDAGCHGEPATIRQKKGADTASLSVGSLPVELLTD